MRIYLAGPDVFLPDAVAMGRRKTALCANYGHVGLYPLDSGIDIAAPDASLDIFRANQAMMDSADAVVANLTPFRGPSADAGTVYELGYMAGRGKLCLGYSNDPEIYADRVRKLNLTSPDTASFDLDGLAVEDFRHADNLMIVHALEDHGGPLIVPREAPADLWHDLTSFEDCLRMLNTMKGHAR
ncbi:MAG: nucleoside 2-deoxyribosyltransferase [Bradyrhizobiaceae bacterium]|nr:MAG: nucleoside 2-deoxyribosyltransferase [Bradyrhizobiaceae bacterium]